MPSRSVFRIAIGWGLLGALLPVHAQHSSIQVLILGTDHLRQVDRRQRPYAVSLIREHLARFEPDHIVVEWLHPSISRQQAFNYGDLGDMGTLAKFWGYNLEQLDSSWEARRKNLERLKARDLPTGEARLELGKLHYLKGDQLNAGYQWWRAHREGKEVRDLWRLTRRNFEGHELRVWGFEIALKQGIEYLTPFDYQGEDTGWKVFGEILSRTREEAIAQKHGIQPGEEGWEARMADYRELESAFLERRDGALLERYGSVPEVRQLLEAFREFDRLEAQTPASPDGLQLIRYWQSEAYLSAQRRIQYEVIPALSLDGLGALRTEGNRIRNEKMWELAHRDIERLGSTKVLVIVGAGHKFFLEDIARAQGYSVVDATRFLP